MKQINSSFGSGGMALAMSEVEFASFIMFLKSRTVQNEVQRQLPGSHLKSEQPQLGTS